MRTRFAPSPTGFLHVGNLRTALYAYLMAKQSDGTFLVRIEDTDQGRSVEGAIENMFAALAWMGIVPDEGVMMQKGVMTEKGTHGPYIQSRRLELYQHHAKVLLEKGHAYRCFCTGERLEKMRTRQQEAGQAPMYDRLCLGLSPEEVERRLAAGEPHVLRMKTPRDRIITFEDDIRGQVSFQSHLVDDQVLLKSDGFPTYHLAHVVDDHLMDISLVIRGEEWLSSLPKHLLLFEYFGWQPPRYAHVPLLLNADHTKLSKRAGAVTVEEYMTKGYLPEAMANFLALLGWNGGTTQEIFSMQELISAFSIDRVQKSGAVFDLQKLDWLQGQWMRALDPETFVKRVQMIVSKRFPAAANDRDFAAKAALIRERIAFFSDAPSLMGFFYEEPKAATDLLVNEKQKVTKELLPEVLRVLTETLDSVLSDEWTESVLKERLTQAAEKNGWKPGQLLWVLRAALTGLPFSPGAYEVAIALGKDTSIARLENATMIRT
ncbi:MAG: glutamate--tRNA ligase [Candidatus Peregrinibacteria bacterium]